MINPSNITIIIPIFNLQDNRLENFYKVIESLSETEIKVLVPEQLKNGTKSKIIHAYSNITMLECFHDSDLINKSKLINYAVSKANTKYIWQLDADVLLKWDFILTKITDEDVIRPFESIIKLSEEETSVYYRDESIVVKKGETREAISTFGPMAYIIKKDIFIKEGGMCEKFEGWGWEDLDFARKIKSNYKISVIDKSFGIHLWHTHTQSKESEEKSNKKIYNEITPIESNEKIEKKETNTNLSLNPKFIHITSYYFKNNNEDKRQLMSSSSIYSNIPQNSKFINLYYDKTHICNNAINIKTDDTKPFIDNIAKIASDFCDNDTDIIIYTNSDCMIDEEFYTNIQNNIDSPCFLCRRDILTNYDNNIENIYFLDNNLLLSGIDGFAITKHQFDKFNQIIPHMKIGEPYWDTIVYSEFLKNKIKINTLNGILYHIDHDRFWSINDDCYNVKYKKENFPNSDCAKLPYTIKSPVVSIICCSYMGVFNKEVLDSQRIFLKNIRYQNIPHEIIFVEMGFNGKFYFNDISDLGLEVGNVYKHIKIDGNESHKFLFHKESLFNIGTKHASTKYLIFCDADIICKNINWLKMIHKTLYENKDIVIQPFETVTDTKDENIKYTSACSRLIDGNFKFKKVNPGICWAMTNETYTDIGGFNNLCIFGDGDTCFLEEIVSPDIMPLEKMASVTCKRLYLTLHNMRKIEKKRKIGYLKNIHLTHIFHGYEKSRKYFERNYILFYIQEIYKKTLFDYINVGPINSWKTLDNEALWLIKKKTDIPLVEKDAFSFFKKTIDDNYSMIYAGSTLLLDLPKESEINYFKIYNNRNISKKYKNQAPVKLIDNVKFIELETEVKEDYGCFGIWFANWEYKDLNLYSNLYIEYNSSSDCYYSFAGKNISTPERKLIYGINKLERITGMFNIILFKFKQKIQINKIYLVRE